MSIEDEWKNNLNEWKKTKRKDWDQYDESIKKYNEAREKLQAIPSVDKFVDDIRQILHLQENNAEDYSEKIKQIFSQKSESSWEKGKGEERMKNGINDYIKFLDEAFKLNDAAKNDISDYLDKLNDKILPVLKIPYSIRGAGGIEFRIINGNKYIKLLKLIDDIRNDRRDELRKYKKFTRADLEKKQVSYTDNDYIFGLSNAVFELYGIANLHLDGVYIYNSKVKLDNFGYHVNKVSTFADLFDLFDKYDKFVNELYRDFYITSNDDYLKKITSPLENSAKVNILKHIEVDQFFNCYGHKKSLKRGLNASNKEKENEDISSKNNKEHEAVSDNSIRKNFILHGPVGTGKTYIAQKLAIGIVSNKMNSLEDIENVLNNVKILEDLSDAKIDSKLIKKVTFHQSYGYEDFIEGLKAKTEDGTIKYNVEPGFFRKICEEADKDKNNRYVLIIDEINRGDISRIFGELITLLDEDKRKGRENEISVTLPYSGEQFSVPDNLYIIGTMNDSDKSISLIDVALRRRFVFFNVPPNSELLGEWMSNYSKKNEVIKSFKALNRRITENKGEDFQIGHAFFVSLAKSPKDEKEIEKELLHIFKYRIFPLLRELFYRKEDVLFKKVLNEKFYEKIDNNLIKLKKDVLNSPEKFMEELIGLGGDSD